MNRRLALCAVLAACWLAVGCSDDDADDQPTADTTESTVSERTTTTTGPVEIAIAGRSAGTFGGDAPCGDGGTTIATDGSGSANGLGDFTLHAEHCSAIERQAILDGLMTMTLADGDTIEVTYTGSFASLDDLAAVS